MRSGRRPAAVRRRLACLIHLTPQYAAAWGAASDHMPSRGQAGRQIERTGHTNKATLKPTTPLLTLNTGPLKPTTPLRPKTAPKTPISHPQRRSRFQTSGPPDQQDLPRCRWATAGPGRAHQNHRHRRCGGHRKDRRAWPGFEPTRPATPQHARHRRCGERRRDLPRCRWAAAGPGRASRRRAERSSQRGRLAGGPPPTGTHSGRAQQRPEHQRDHKQQTPATDTTKRAGTPRFRPALDAQRRSAAHDVRQ